MSIHFFNPDKVGVPTPWTGIKLVDVPEMNYFAKEDKGEICFRGGNLMNGYFQMPEKTAETIGKIHIFRFYQHNLIIILNFCLLNNMKLNEKNVYLRLFC